MRPEHKQFKDGILQTLIAPSCLRASAVITHRQRLNTLRCKDQIYRELAHPRFSGMRVRKLQGPCQMLPGGDVHSELRLWVVPPGRVLGLYNYSLCLMLYTRSSICTKYTAVLYAVQL